MREGHGILLLLLLTIGAANAQSFTRLTFQEGHETEAVGLRLTLAEPNKPTNPDLWEGPLTVAHGGTHCAVDDSLIQDVYLSSTGKLLVVVSISGSNTFVRLFDPLTCASRWREIKTFTHGVTVEGTHLKLAPACACEQPGKPCSCTAGLVYRLSNDSAPAYLPAQSRALTRRALGVGFTGTRRLAHPGESAAH